MESNEIVQTRKIYKSYGRGSQKVDVLSGVSLSVSKGEFLSVVGKSGSGKSTLLHCLGGLLSIDDGEVLVDHVELRSLSSNALSKFRRDTVGFIFQDLNLINSLNVSDNVRLPAKLAGVPVSSQKIRDVLVKVGLGDKRKAYPGELSGGQRQRVAIARAIVRNPPLLLADEPTGSLDSAATEVVMDLFINSVGPDVAKVMVTHDLDLASRADRVIVLEDGRIKDVLSGVSSETIFDVLHAH